MDVPLRLPHHCDLVLISQMFEIVVFGELLNINQNTKQRQRDVRCGFGDLVFGEIRFDETTGDCIIII